MNKRRKLFERNKSLVESQVSFLAQCLSNIKHLAASCTYFSEIDKFVQAEHNDDYADPKASPYRCLILPGNQLLPAFNTVEIDSDASPWAGSFAGYRSPIPTVSEARFDIDAYGVSNQSWNDTLDVAHDVYYERISPDSEFHDKEHEVGVCFGGLCSLATEPFMRAYNLRVTTYIDIDPDLRDYVHRTYGDRSMTIVGDAIEYRNGLYDGSVPSWRRDHAVKRKAMMLFTASCPSRSSMLFYLYNK